MDEPEAQLYAGLKADHPEFRRLAEKHRELDPKITEFGPIHYLTIEQERRRKELRKQELASKDRLYILMRQQAGGTGHGRF
jgi:uncharacterized protein YdcH (DUF465 family)